VKIFRKPKSKFYWYDFTIRGRRYRWSTQETKAECGEGGDLRLAEVIDGTASKSKVFQKSGAAFYERDYSVSRSFCDTLPGPLDLGFGSFHNGLPKNCPLGEGYFFGRLEACKRRLGFE
jgi:hypothetical protein